MRAKLFHPTARQKSIATAIGRVSFDAGGWAEADLTPDGVVRMRAIGWLHSILDSGPPPAVHALVPPDAPQEESPVSSLEQIEVPAMAPGLEVSLLLGAVVPVSEVVTPNLPLAAGTTDEPKDLFPYKKKRKR